MKVLKKGKDTKIVCPNCRTKLLISAEDILPNGVPMQSPDEYGHVICPNCGKYIRLSRSVWTNNWIVDE